MNVIFPHNEMSETYNEAKDGVVFIFSEFSDGEQISTDVSKKGIMVNLITASVDAVLIALILISTFIRRKHPVVTENVR